MSDAQFEPEGFFNKPFHGDYLTEVKRLYQLAEGWHVSWLPYEQSTGESGRQPVVVYIFPKLFHCDRARPTVIYVDSPQAGEALVSVLNQLGAYSSQLLSRNHYHLPPRFLHV